MIYPYENQHPKQAPDSFTAETAVLIGNVTIESNVSIWFGAVLRGDIEPITIGAESNIQDNSVVHTSYGFPTSIGRGVSVGHLVNLHGCTVHDNCIIGMDATLLDGCVIGKNCIIGANALVTQNQQIPEGSLVLGSPARVVRQLTDEQIAGIRENAKHYIEAGKKYRDL